MDDMLMFTFCLGCREEQRVLVCIFDEPSCMVRYCHFNAYPFRSTLLILPQVSLSNSIF